LLLSSTYIWPAGVALLPIAGDFLADSGTSSRK
jgi:hypothetical protein